LIRAVFFDLYETLITEWKDNSLKAPYSNDEIGLDSKLFKQEWQARKDQRMDGSSQNYKCVLRDNLISQEQKIDEKIIDSLYLKRVHSKSIPFKSIDNDILVTLKSLRTIGIKIGLISNCASEEVLAWNTCELSELFQSVLFSYDVKVAKPNAQIYLLACKSLGVAPDQSVFIGDGGSNELAGASKVGMAAYHATWYQPLWLSKRISEFPKLNNPTQIIDIINNRIRGKV
jgi:FMN phosphatase YigB (HAD superfamily)